MFDTSFECALCTPNDYCFNNSRYNCSDERMLSDAGSAYFANCTYMAGYYNNGTRCEACHVDTYCVGDGVPRACPAHEWTSDERAYSECYCKPGYHSPALPPASPKGCELCPVDSFCPGEYDARWNCTPHSTSAAGSAVDVDCLCLPGFGNVTTRAAARRLADVPRVRAVCRQVLQRHDGKRGVRGMYGVPARP